MWKILDFCFIQILREINFGDLRSAKIATFATLGALNIVDLVNFSLQKVQKYIYSKFGASKCVEMADSTLLDSPKLISRKI